jgi:hypothetical protein
MVGERRGMSTHAAEQHGGSTATLPDALPFTLGPLTRLSWELGDRIVTGEETTCHSRWEATDAGWSLAVFRTTSHTDLLRVRTPVGRIRFYGAVHGDIRQALSALERDANWTRAD